MSDIPEPEDRPGSPRTGSRSWVAPGGADAGPVEPALPTGWSAAPSPPSAPPTPGAPPVWGSGIDNPPAPPMFNPLTAHQPGILPLRPLGIGDIAQAAFGSIRRAPGIHYVAALAVWIVALLLAALVTFGIVQPLTTGGWTLDVDDLDAGTVDAMSTVLLLASIIAIPPLTGFASYLVGQQAIGQTPNGSQVWRHLRPALGRVIAVSLVITVATVAVVGTFGALLTASEDSSAIFGVLLILLIVGAVVAFTLTVRLAFWLPALVVEGLGIVAAARRSLQLTRGMFWRTVGVLLLTGLSVTMISVVVSGLFGTNTMGLALNDAGSAITVGAVLTFLGALMAYIATAPIVPTMLAVLHVDARIRSEAFDLTLSQAAFEAAAGRGPGALS